MSGPQELEKQTTRLEQLQIKATIKDANKKGKNGDGDDSARGRGRGRGGRGRAAGACASGRGRGRGRGRRNDEWEDWDSLFSPDEWEEWLRWKSQWPAEPAEHEQEAEEPPVVSGKGKKAKALPKEKAQANEKEEIPAESEKKKRKSEPMQDDNGNDEEHENATFARRYQPAREFPAARWRALREAFNHHVRPLCSAPSSFEVGSVTFWCLISR